MNLRSKLRKLLIWSFAIAIFCGSFLGAVGVSQKAKAADETRPPDTWSTDIVGNIQDHSFDATDDFKTITDTSMYNNNDGPIASGDHNVTIEYTYSMSPDYWSIYSYNDVLHAPEDNSAAETYFNNKQEKNVYNLYTMKIVGGASLDHYYLITETSSTGTRTLGIFRDKIGMNPTCRGAGSLDNEECPYFYYQAQNSVGIMDPSTWNNGHWLKVSYNAEISDQYSFQAKYIKSINEGNSRNGYNISSSIIGGDCPNGSQLSADEYKKCYWPKGGTFDGTISAGDGTKAPTIHIGASTATSPSPTKPSDFTFTLKYVLRTRGSSEFEGNWFYYVSTDPNHPNLAVRLEGCKNTGPIITFDTTNASSWTNQTVTEVGVQVTVPKDKLYSAVIKKVYNDDSTDPAKVTKSGESADFGTDYCPYVRSLNVTDGNLKTWGVTSSESAESQADTKDTCGVQAENFVTRSIAKVLCAFIQAMGSAGAWIIKTFGIANVINAYHPSLIHRSVALVSKSISIIPIAHAEDDPNTPNESSIKNALNNDPPWVLTAWKTVLGIANVFVVIVLLFIAITNILHLQYDTFAIKKALPTLIIGIILANFSVFITKMFVDAVNVLTNTFTHGSAGTMIQSLITSIVPESGKPTFLASTPDIFSLLLALLFSFFAIIVFLIIGFLFYIRYIVIITLTIAAPLAFVLMAFPPTQGIFKQWWGWYAKFLFMKPISIFLIWLASMVLDSSGGRGLTVWAISVFLMCAAIIVPFKMGGAIMAGWGKVGKWAASPVTNAAKKGYEGKRDAWKQRANNWVNKNTAVGRWRQSHELEMATLKGEEKAIQDKREKEVRQRKGSRQHLREEEIQYAAGDLEEEKLSQQNAIESGKFNHISKRQMRKITGQRDQMEVALRYVNQANRLKSAQEGLEKRRSLDLNMISIRDLREDTDFREGLKAMQGVGDDIKADFNEDGTTAAPGSVSVTYARAVEIAEELRFKAKGETDATKRQELEKAAKHFDKKAESFAQGHQTFTAGAMKGEKIEYQRYLSRNLSGRRMKFLNPPIIEDADIQTKSGTHAELVTDTEKATGTFGTSEWQARKVDYDNYLTGNIKNVDASAAYACLVQAHGTKMVMDTGRRGDIKGLETIDLFSKRVMSAGRGTFKKDLATTALGQLSDDQKKCMEKEIVRQYKLTNPGFTGTYSSMTTAQQEDALNGLDFTKLEVKGQGKDSSAHRTFVDRYLTGVETDDKLGFSKSPGAMLKKH